MDPIVAPVGSIWAPFGLPLGSLLALFLGGPFFRVPDHPGGGRTLKPTLFGTQFGSLFRSFFHHFSEDPKTMILHYLTVLFKVFDLPKALILGSIFDSVLGSVFGPLPGRSAGGVGLEPRLPRGSFWARRGEDLGGGFD